MADAEDWKVVDRFGGRPDAVIVPRQDFARAMKLLAWFEAFKAEAAAHDFTQGKNALPPPQCMTQGDLTRQTTLAIIAKAEAAMEEQDG